MCIAQDFLRGDIIIGSDNFLYTIQNFLKGDDFVGSANFFG